MTNKLPEKALDILRSNTLMVLSTTSSEDGRPESALVAFAENGMGEMFFGTSNQTRKYQNIMQDNRVSIVVGWDAMGSLQIEGVADELSGDDTERAAAAIIAKNPHSEKFLRKDDARVFAVKVSWVRLIDFVEGNQEVKL